MDEMIYNPGTQEGSIAISVLQGVFVFVSGEVAKTSVTAMVIATPVGTVGIRGTQLGLSYTQGRGLRVALMPEANGFVGEIVVENQGGVQVINKPNQATDVASATAAPTEPETISDEAMAETFGSALGNMPQSSGVNMYGVEPAEDEEAGLEDFATAAGGGGGLNFPAAGGATAPVELQLSVVDLAGPGPGEEASPSGGP